MSNELAPGDLAVIIESALGISVGKIVQCVDVIGYHSQHGIVWNVRSKDGITTEYGAHGHSAHVPAAWLRKIRPGELDKNKDKRLELTE